MERRREAGEERALPPSAAAAVDAFSRRFAAMAEESIRARYELGRMLHEIAAVESVAEHVLQVVAGALDVHPSLLQRYVRVASVILPPGFEIFLALRNPRGRPLTWSHLEHLAEVRSAKLRAILAEQVVAEQLSVRALVACIRSTKTRPAPSPPSPVAGLRSRLILSRPTPVG
jgi:hypothetical protein